MEGEETNIYRTTKLLSSHLGMMDAFLLES